MEIEEKIRKILFEQTMTAPADPGSGAGGGKVGVRANLEDKPSTLRKKDARRKRRERSREKAISGLPKPKKVQDEAKEMDPRANLQGPMRLTLKETFLSSLVEYITTRKSRPILEAITLMEEYPKLKKFVTKKSRDSLPTRGFSVYAVRESTMNEEVGSPAYRTGTNAHNWCLNKSQAKRNSRLNEGYYIMEAKILPNHVLLYLPAFASDIENFIYEGKLMEEPQTNVLRMIKQQNEVILPSEIDTGLVVEIE